MIHAARGRAITRGDGGVNDTVHDVRGIDIIKIGDVARIPVMIGGSQTDGIAHRALDGPPRKFDVAQGEGHPRRLGIVVKVLGIDIDPFGGDDLRDQVGQLPQSQRAGHPAADEGEHGLPGRAGQVGGQPDS